MSKDQGFVHFADKAPVSKKSKVELDKTSKKLEETSTIASNGFSASTQEIINRLKSKQQPKRDKSKSPRPSKLEEEIPFDKLPQSNPSSH